VRAGLFDASCPKFAFVDFDARPCNSTSALGQPPWPFDPELINDVGLTAQAR
jgi:hypothetical protein